MNKTVYLASTLANWARVREIKKILEDNGITITMDWTLWGEQIFSDSCDTKPDFDPDVLGEKAEEEFSGVTEAEYLLIILPGGKGTHFEFGAFYMKHWQLRPPHIPEARQPEWKAPITILDEENAKIPTSFHHMKGINRTTSEQEAVNNVLGFFGIEKI